MLTFFFHEDGAGNRSGNEQPKRPSARPLIADSSSQYRRRIAIWRNIVSKAREKETERETERERENRFVTPIADAVLLNQIPRSPTARSVTLHPLADTRAYVDRVSMTEKF